MARVLLIHDCPELRTASRLMLQRHSLEVFEARDALAGMQLAVEECPDWILVAEDLPGLSGAQVKRRLADEPMTASIPVILMGASHDLSLSWMVPPAARTLVSAQGAGARATQSEAPMMSAAPTSVN